LATQSVRVTKLGRSKVQKWRFVTLADQSHVKSNFVEQVYAD